MTESVTPEPKFRRRADARPDEVLDAAIELFAEQGFGKTTVEQVAKRAGLSKGAVYLYFPSKDAILEGLVKRTFEPIADQMFEMMAAYRGDPRPIIGHFLRAMGGILGKDHVSAVPVIILREAAAVPSIAVHFREAVLDRALPAMTALLKQGVEGGYIRAIDPELTARTVMGPVIVHLLLSEVFAVRPKGGLNPEALIDNHLSILFAGLEPPKE